ncbi:MAG: hypothetical protein KJO43_12760 [Phycisphaerae bacterium]|nr:hypothetical protein [Phycisphaerae bacterium]
MSAPPTLPSLPDAPAAVVAGPAATESTESFPAEITPRIAPTAARVARVPAHETDSARDAPPVAPRSTRADASRARLTPRPSVIPLATAGTTPERPQLTRTLPNLPPDTLALETRLPPVARPRPNPYPQRAPEKRQALVQEMGGSVATERAVSLALDWLARHQSADGRWHSYDFDDECGGCAGAARADVDIALTGLSVLCFLAANHLPDAPGPYRDVVAKGLDWLRRQQGDDGNLVADESMYSHGIATIALAEAYGMTGDQTLEEPVRQAARFIVESANQSVGGWRYAPRQPGDSSVLGWQIMALKSARRCRLDVDETGFDVAREWLPRVQSRSRPGLYAYQPNRTVTPAMTAEMMFVRQLLGGRPSEPAMVNSARYLLRHVPDWEHDTNTYFWYYGTLALYQHQGEAWERWNEIIKDELLAHQETRGPAAGSWPIEGDRWARTGGRVYQTAICTLTLEVYYRYLPLYLDETPPGP